MIHQKYLKSIFFSLLVSLTACGPSPTESHAKLIQALQKGSPDAVVALLHEDYRDPLGGAQILKEDLSQWQQHYGRRQVSATELIVSGPAAEKTVMARLDFELVGEPNWKVVGPWQVTLRRRDGFRVYANVLSEIRDIQRLMEHRKNALEANDPTSFGQVLHPRYRDGDLNASQAQQRFESHTQGLALRLRPTHYRVELRGHQAHLDEHYELSIGGQKPLKGVARLTLAKSAGRFRILSGLYPKSPSSEPGNPKHP